MEGYIVVWVILIGFLGYYMHLLTKELQKIEEKIDKLEDNIKDFNWGYTDLCDLQECIVCDIKGITREQKREWEVTKEIDEIACWK